MPSPTRREGDAPFFPLSDPVCAVLFQGPQAKLAASRERKDAGIEVFRYKYSDSLEIQRVKDLVSKAANAHPDLQENVDEFGRCYGTGVRSNWNGVRHVNGYPMRNGTWPMASNRERRVDAGLSNEWVESWHKTVFEAFVRHFFSDLAPTALKLRKGSSTVIPFFTKDQADRKALAKRALEEAKSAGTMMLAGNYEEAFLAHQFGGAYYVVYRRQSTDKITVVDGKYVPKERLVATFEYAISGGTRGSMFASDKEMGNVDFPVLKGMFRERLRTAMGGAFQLNVALMPVMQSCRKKLYSEFAFSFHHTTRASKEEKTRKFAFNVMVDVTDHDMLWPGELYVPVITDTLLSMGFADWWVKLLETSFKLPIYVGAPAEDEGHILIGDWREPDLAVGLPSGQSGTDVFGTLGMSFIYFLAQVEHTSPRLIPQLKTIEGAMSVVERYLKGLLDFAAMSKADDAQLVWREGTILRSAMALQQKLVDKVQVSPYMLLSYEHGGAFLGDILLYDASRQLSKSTFVGNILSQSNNTLSPEYGVQSGILDRSKVNRGFPGLAYISHKEVYGSAPGYQALSEVLEKAWRSVFRESWEAFRVEEYRADLARLSQYMTSVAKNKGLDHLSTQDKEVLVDADKLRYKYDSADIDPDVVALSEYQIPVEEVETYFNAVTNRRS